MSTSTRWQVAGAYGLMAAPLAFAALPLYVLFPQFYATELGVSLGALGALLLLVRALDAITDPLIGRWLDRHLSTTNLWRISGLTAATLVAGFWAVFHAQPDWSGTGLLVWAGLTLTLCTGAYSVLTLTLQSWVSRVHIDHIASARPMDKPIDLPTDTPTDVSVRTAWLQRRLIAWREGLGLLGVVIGASLPAVVGMTTTSAVLLALTALALWAWWWVLPQLPLRSAAAMGAASPSTTHAISSGHPPDQAMQHAGFFRQLMLVHVINGMASAIPATLVLFFVRDRLQAPAGTEGLLLLLYFCAAGAAMPLWQRAMAQLGLVATWGAAMVLATGAFAVTATLGAGDMWWFAVVCVASGLALGADLCVPQAMMAQWLNRPQPLTPTPAPASATATSPTTSGARTDTPSHAHTSPTHTRQDGVYFGWWNVVSKGNLALAAGVALPLLGVLGYTPGNSDNTVALAWVYGALPCVLKIMAAALLWYFWFHTHPKGATHVDSNPR